MSTKALFVVAAVVFSLALSESQEPGRFSDLKVVCLGCSSGIGQATAEYLAAGGAGVVACSRSATFDWITTSNLSASIHMTKCDASDIESLKDLLTFSVQTLGEITGLVYVPTYMGSWSDPDSSRPIQRVDLEHVLTQADKQFNIDYKGFIASVHIFLKDLRETGRGSVVAISSIASELYLMGSFNQNLHYGAVKSAQNYAVRNLAKTYAHVPVRFNTVSPGVTDTAIFSTFSEEVRKAFFDDVALQTPIMRHAESMEIGTTVAFLLSQEASYITGIDLKVDGGYRLMDGSAGQTLGNSAEDMEDAWMRMTVNRDFDLETKSLRNTEAQCSGPSD